MDLKVSPELSEYVNSFKELMTLVLSWGNLGPPPQPRRNLTLSGDGFGFHNWEESTTGI